MPAIAASSLTPEMISEWDAENDFPVIRLADVMSLPQKCVMSYMVKETKL